MNRKLLEPEPTEELSYLAVPVVKANLKYLRAIINGGSNEPKLNCYIVPQSVLVMLSGDPAEQHGLPKGIGSNNVRLF